MPYSKHWLLSFGGKAFTTEEWSCNLRFKSSGIGPADDGSWNQIAADAIDDVRDDVVNFFANVPYCFSAAHTLDFVKFNAIGENGRYLDTSNTRARYPAGVVGTGAPVMPPQIALVLSLRTDAERGRAHAGRIFLPASKFTVGADGRISQAQVDATMLWTRTFISNLNNWPGLDLPWEPEVHIVSGINGDYRPVTKMRIGRVLDTQRRRREDLLEEYTEGAATAP